MGAAVIQTVPAARGAIIVGNEPAGCYSGCQKNVPLIERFFLQPFIPPFRIAKFIFEKRYNRLTLSFPANTYAGLLPRKINEILGKSTGR